MRKQILIVVGWGYPDQFYLLIGGFEMIGAILIFIPKFASRAAVGLSFIMISAVATHLIHGEGMRVLAPAIIGGILALVYFLRKNG